MLRQDRACLHHLLCIFTKLIKQNCAHLQAVICMHFFRFFWQEYAAVLQRKKRNKGVQRTACRHISLDYSYPYILQAEAEKSTKSAIIRRFFTYFFVLTKWVWTFLIMIGILFLIAFLFKKCGFSHFVDTLKQSAGANACWLLFL